jgi:hypothetical protein
MSEEDTRQRNKSKVFEDICIQAYDKLSLGQSARGRKLYILINIELVKNGYNN